MTSIFLILLERMGRAIALGIVCIITYWQTASLSIPIVIHWLAVVLWLLCFGGLTKLNYKLAETK